MLLQWRSRLVDAVPQRSRWANILEPAFALPPVVFHAVLLVMSGMLLAGGTYNPFIYFRF
jgi:hypothetical protein